MSELILVRTHKFDSYVKRFCDELSEASGRKPVLLMDETHGPVDTRPYLSIPCSRAIYEKELHLFAPKDSLWRCGDYGLYRALFALPFQRHFWLIEYDVRFRGQDTAREVFRSFDGSELDLVAPFLSKRDSSWWWTPSMQRRGSAVWGCLFPIVRVSTDLLRKGLAERLKHGRSPLYRLFWPNDEAFLATVAKREQFKTSDLNTTGYWYSDATFSYDRPWSEDELEKSGNEYSIYHPVLYDQELTVKRNRLTKPSTKEERARRKLRRLLKALA